MNIVLLGAPGAGKGTYAQILSKKFNMPHISTGDLLREVAKEESELAQEIKKIMDSGELISDNLILELLEKRIEKEDCKNGFILDGYPRNITQAETLSDFIKIDIVFHFVASEHIILERLGGRLTCSGCGAVFHIKNIPPKIENKCDYCGASLYQREDQKPEAIKKRLRIYDDITDPLIEYYRNKNILHQISSDPPVEEIGRIINPCIKIIESKLDK
ncbi:MAG: adenylate kinase [archaeon]|nr:adenylate kinase [archaeon]